MWCNEIISEVIVNEHSVESNFLKILISLRKEEEEEGEQKSQFDFKAFIGTLKCNFILYYGSLLTLREFWVLLYAMNFFWGCTSPSGISGSGISSWNLHQGWPLIKEVDWWRHQPCHVTRVYFKDQKPLLLTSAKNGWCRHKSTSLVKETP